MADLKTRFIMNFITDDRWKYLADGLVVTLKVTFFAVLIGIAFGFLTYVILMLAKKKYKEVHPVMYGLAVLFIIYFII